MTPPIEYKIPEGVEQPFSFLIIFWGSSKN